MSAAAAFRQLSQAPCSLALLTLQVGQREGALALARAVQVAPAIQVAGFIGHWLEGGRRQRGSERARSAVATLAAAAAAASAGGCRRWQTLRPSRAHSTGVWGSLQAGRQEAWSVQGGGLASAWGRLAELLPMPELMRMQMRVPGRSVGRRREREATLGEQYAACPCKCCSDKLQSGQFARSLAPVRPDHKGLRNGRAPSSSRQQPEQHLVWRAPPDVHPQEVWSLHAMRAMAVSCTAAGWARERLQTRGGRSCVWGRPWLLQQPRQPDGETAQPGSPRSRPQAAHSGRNQALASQNGRPPAQQMLESSGSEGARRFPAQKAAQQPFPDRRPPSRQPPPPPCAPLSPAVAAHSRCCCHSILPCRSASRRWTFTASCPPT